MATIGEMLQSPRRANRWFSVRAMYGMLSALFARGLIGQESLGQVDQATAKVFP
jgi:hypothetical protein